MYNIIISTDKNRLDIKMIHKFLSNQSYWANGRTFDQVVTSIENSLCFGVYEMDGNQIGFARVVTDGAIFGWLADVFVIEQYRSCGVGKQLLNSIMNDIVVEKLKRMGLNTKDAHSFFRDSDFITWRILSMRWRFIWVINSI